MIQKNLVLALSFNILFFGCKDEKTNFDASGTFEATETIISAEANGKIMALNIDEGDVVKKGQVLGYIDTTQLHLSRLQLIQNKKAVLSSAPNVQLQLEVLEKELENAITDKKRLENLVQGNVANQKQLDDAIARIKIIQSRIEALNSQLRTTVSSLNEQGNTLEIQLAQIEDQLRKCTIINPIDGTILMRYANSFEMTGVGKPLYKIADLSSIILRAYISGDQLAFVKLNQKVKVHTDDGKGGLSENEGIVTWINDKAEFTPITIQTKNERANRVYALKVKVKNTGFYKIGMYGEISF